jgi:hypothetical protein
MIIFVLCRKVPIQMAAEKISHELHRKSGSLIKTYEKEPLMAEAGPRLSRPTSNTIPRALTALSPLQNLAWTFKKKQSLSFFTHHCHRSYQKKTRI